MEWGTISSGWPASKVSVPHARAIVRRGRLLDPLSRAAAEGRVTLVVAPGGAGKTTLLTDWSRQTDAPVAWYTLDTADRDVRRLVAGMLASIERAIPGATLSARRMLEQGAPESAAVGMLLSALEGLRLTLVLDDFHQTDDSPDVALLWDHFLRFRPPTLALVILSRTVPLLSFAMLAAMDMLLGMGQRELSFDADEAAQLLRAHNLDATMAGYLAKRSGGWATGVLLLARAAPGGVRQLRSRQDALMAQLGDEILSTLPKRLRAFLLEAAALGPVTPEEADGILERGDSASLFADAAARSLFLELDSGVYRFHDLFADYLISCLGDESAKRLRHVRHAAARWWEEHGDLPRALAQLARDEEWEHLAETLERTRADLWSRRLWSTIVVAVERLPAASRSMRLLELCGHAHLERGDYARALALADAGMSSAEGDDEWIRPALLKAEVLSRSGHYDESLRCIASGLEVATRIDFQDAVLRFRECRGWTQVRLGRFVDGRQDLIDTVDSYRSVGNLAAEARTLTSLVAHMAEAGQVQEAEPYLSRAGALYRRLGDNIMVGVVGVLGARLAAVRGNLDAALGEAESGLEAIRSQGHPSSECEAAITLAAISLDSGAFAEADARAQSAAELASRLDDAPLLNAALRVRIGAALGRRDRAGARKLIEDARTLACTPADHAQLDACEGVLALRSRAFSRAVDRLAAAAKDLEAVHRPHEAARAYLLLAEAALGAGAQRRAEHALNRMADLASRAACEGYLRPTARLARQVVGERRLIRGLRRQTRQLLESLATALPALTLIEPVPEDEERQSRAILEISPFGNGHISLSGLPIHAAALPTKAREVLHFAVRSGGQVARADLLSAIWDDDRRAPQNLWDASRHVRRVLGERAWVTRNAQYTLELTVHDAGHEFDQCASAALGKGARGERLAAAEQALELAGNGGYLEWCESDWAAAERLRLGARAAAVAMAAAALYEELERPQEAITACRRAMAIEPYEEAPRQALLRLLVATGQVDLALLEYNAYRALVHEDLQAEPSSALRTFAAQLRLGR